jgi:hypothetical protein
MSAGGASSGVTSALSSAEQQTQGKQVENIAKETAASLKGLDEASAGRQSAAKLQGSSAATQAISGALSASVK